MKFTPAIFSTLAAVSSVAAHGSFQQLWVNGVDQTDTCANKVSGNSPLWNVATSSIACNLYSTASAKCTVPAGATVDVEMHQQYNDRDCANAAIGGNHDGPVLVYMAKWVFNFHSSSGEADDEILRVDDALSANPNTANWFKVAELGLIKTDYWGTDSLNANCGRLAFKVPECIPSGDYLIKAEGKPVLSQSKKLTDRLVTY